MENHNSLPQEKLSLIMQHVPMGFAEIDKSGAITFLNAQGEVLLKPIWIANGITGDNLYHVLEHIAPAVSRKIKESSDEAGNIFTDELHSFSLSFGGETVERHFSFMAVKMFANCIIVAFDDITSKRGK